MITGRYSRRVLLCTLMCTALTACSTWRSAQSLPELPLLPPASLGVAVQLNQVITVRNKGEKQSLQAAVLLEPEKIHLIAMSQLGQRLLGIQYDGVSIQQSKAVMPEAVTGQVFPAKMILAQLQLAYWPLEVLQQQYTGHLGLVEENCQRILRYRGKQFLNIDYACPETSNIQETAYSKEVSREVLNPLERSPITITQEFSPVSLSIKTVGKKMLPFRVAPKVNNKEEAR